jgi:antitoxin component YwqK of YwqJK toxin-antitoxin module
MKKLLNSIFLLIFSLSSFSQNSESEKLNLVFYSECSGKIITPEFDIDIVPESKNAKILTYYIERDDWISQNTITIDLRKTDTIKIPKILFSGGNELHSQRWTYLNCNKICEGKETDYYFNGNKRLEGIFENGKPSEIKFFRENGTLESQEIYKLGTLNKTRVNYFDEKGILTEYEIHKNRKKKTIIRTFDKNHKQINKEVRHYYIE